MRESEKLLMNTDYLVVGAGASGLAFADTLVAEADVDVMVTDRRPLPQVTGAMPIHSFGCTLLQRSTA